MDKENIERLIVIFEGLESMGKLTSEGAKHLKELKEELERLEDVR